MPVVVWTIRRLGEPHTLIGDAALFDLRARDVFSAHVPLVGLYSRFGWNHPGPFSFYWAAPFRLIDGGFVGEVLAAAAWSLVALIVTAVLARRRGGLAVVLGSLLAQLLVWLSVGGAATTYTWPPYLALSLFVPFLLAAWGAAVGDRTSTMATVALASVMLQVHAGFGLVVVVPLVVAGGVAVHDGLLRRQTALRCALIVVVLWSPVALDAAVHSGGNAGELASFFTASKPRPVGVATGVRMLAAEARPWPEWLLGPAREVGFGGRATGANPAWLVALLVVVVAAVGASVRDRDRSAVRLLMVVGGSLLAALVSATEVRGTPFAYVVLWRASTVVMVLFASAIAISRRAAHLRRPLDAGFLGVGIAAMLLAATVGVLATRSDQSTLRGGEQAVEQLTRAGERTLSPDDTVLIRFGDASYAGIAAGVFHQMIDHGDHAVVDRGLAYLAGPQRAARVSTASVVWYVTEGSISAALYEDQPGARVVAADFGGLTEPEATHLHVLQRAVADQLRNAGRSDLVPALGSDLAAYIIRDVPGVDTATAQRISQLNANTRDPTPEVIAFAPSELPHVWWPGPTDTNLTR